MSYINNEQKASHASEDLVHFPGTELGLYPQKPTLFPSASLCGSLISGDEWVGNPNSFGTLRWW